MKLCVLRCAYFSDGWNLLDFAVVCASILDCWILRILFHSASALYSISAVRLFRLLRLIQVIKFLKAKRELILIVEAFGSSLSTLFWISVVVCIALYVCAIFCVEVIGRAEAFHGMDEGFDQERLFGGVARAMVTLVGVALLAEWSAVVRPVVTVQPLLIMFFLLFTTVITFGLLNVVVGVITERTEWISRRQRQEELKQCRQKQKCMVLKVADTLFKGDRMLPHAEFINMGIIEELKHAFNGVDLPYSLSLSDLFHLLDTDVDGHLSAIDFTTSMKRLIFSNSFQRHCLKQQQASQIFKSFVELRKEVEASHREVHELAAKEVTALKLEFDALLGQLLRQRGVIGECQAPLVQSKCRPKVASDAVRSAVDASMQMNNLPSAGAGVAIKGAVPHAAFSGENLDSTSQDTSHVFDVSHKTSVASASSLPPSPVITSGPRHSLGALPSSEFIFSGAGKPTAPKGGSSTEVLPSLPRPAVSSTTLGAVKAPQPQPQPQATPIWPSSPRPQRRSLRADSPPTGEPSPQRIGASSRTLAVRGRESRSRG
eukprot:gnl/TRDRNA2_/TRDRNA2_200089_c0_seq1.p1 gnl/TRDRNA2_/TRDRNA2_200089_c0~~gnl/TRDRNA2_/TRDRNA2_200089_c0_seq1.p1  ORF type:complete len:544 (+),score=45.12 gnl/TRDRNA2_/TRDRNA2_200089_c0_seq1:3-1634(+)